MSCFFIKHQSLRPYYISVLFRVTALFRRISNPTNVDYKQYLWFTPQML